MYTGRHGEILVKAPQWTFHPLRTQAAGSIAGVRALGLTSRHWWPSYRPHDVVGSHLVPAVLGSPVLEPGAWLRKEEATRPKAAKGPLILPPTR